MSSMGDISDTMENAPLPVSKPEHSESGPRSIPALAKTEQNRAIKLDRQIIEDRDAINKHFKRMAQNLAEMHSRRLYFAFGFFTFEEYCQKRLGKSRQYIYKIVQAYDTMKFLENQGVSEEDTDALSERLVREIRALPLYKQAAVAKAVARIKRQQGRAATIIEVQAEAAKIDGDEDQVKIERQQKEALSKFEGMARGLKVSLAFDTMTDDFRRRLTVSLMSIADSVKVLLASLNSSAVEQRLAPTQLTGGEGKAKDH
jgi:hypothetical protein